MGDEVKMNTKQFWATMFAIPFIIYTYAKVIYLLPYFLGKYFHHAFWAAFAIFYIYVTLFT